MSNIRNKLQELCDGFNAHDLDRIMSLFADDCILEMPRGEKAWGNAWKVRRLLGKDWPAGSKACAMCTTVMSCTSLLKMRAQE